MPTGGTGLLPVADARGAGSRRAATEDYSSVLPTTEPASGSGFAAGDRPSGTTPGGPAARPSRNDEGRLAAPFSMRWRVAPTDYQR